MRTVAGPSTADYRAAIALATRAPSLHNTQPWRWTVTSGGLELRADRTRHLTRTDGDGNGLLLGCGAALYLARLGLRALGWQCRVERLPDPADPDLLARLSPTVPAAPDPRVTRRAAAAACRHSERRPFDPRPVPDDVLEDLREAASDSGDSGAFGAGPTAGGVYLHVVRGGRERLDLAVAASWADRQQQADSAVRAELERWVRADDSAPDGVPASTLPHLTGGQPRHTEVPVRDFERSGVTGRQPVSGLVDERPALAVLFTTADGPAARLRAGEALARVLVRAAELGLASSLVSQPVDDPGIRARVRVLMSWPDHPRVIVRLGWPPAGPAAAPTGRRGVDEVCA